MQVSTKNSSAAGYLTRYTYEMVSRENGRHSSEDGVFLDVYAADRATADRKARYQNRRQGWASRMVLIEEEHGVTAWGHIAGHVSDQNEPPTVWYRNTNSPIGLCIQGRR